MTTIITIQEAHRRTRSVIPNSRAKSSISEAALEAKKRLAAQDAKQASCPDLDSGATCWGLIPDRTACRVPCTLSVVASPPTLVWHSSNEDNKVQRRTWRWGDLNEDGEPQGDHASGCIKQVDAVFEQLEWWAEAARTQRQK